MMASPTFEVACRLERPLADARSLLHALLILCSEVDEPVAGAMYAVAHNALRDIKELEGVYQALFQATHPDRDKLNREGWPGDEPAG